MNQAERRRQRELQSRAEARKVMSSAWIKMLSDEYIPDPGSIQKPPFEDLSVLWGSAIPVLLDKLMEETVTQNLHFIGPSGVGKTTNLANSLFYLENKFSTSPGLVTCLQMEQMHELCKRKVDKKRNYFVHPALKSGQYGIRDYRIVNYAYFLAHNYILSATNAQLVLGEAVSTTGLLDEELREIGMQRGTDAIDMLRTDNSVSLIALTTGRELYEAAIRSRAQESGAVPEVRPSGSPAGTWLIEDDIAAMLERLFPEIAVQFVNRDPRVIVLLEFFYQWFICEYFQIKGKDRYAVAYNHFKYMTSDELRQRHYEEVSIINRYSYRIEEDKHCLAYILDNLDAYVAELPIAT